MQSMTLEPGINASGALFDMPVDHDAAPAITSKFAFRAEGSRKKKFQPKDRKI